MGAQAWKMGECLTAPPDAMAGKWESRKAFVREPWRVPPKVFIDEREIAIKKHDEMVKRHKTSDICPELVAMCPEPTTICPESTATRLTPLVIYIDGSGLKEKIGGAAIVVEGPHQDEC